MWALWISTAVGATWTVAPSGGDFADLQLAIDGAADGDEIVLSAGLWNGPYVLQDRELTITAPAGPDATLTTAPALADVFTATGGTLTLSGVGVQPDSGRALSATAMVLTADNVVITGGGRADLDGGAVYLEATTATLTGFRVRGTQGRRGVLHATAASQVILDDLEVRETTADHGAALFATNSDVLAYHLLVEDVVAAHSGGAIYLDDSTLTALDPEIRRTRGDASWGAAVYLVDGSLLDVIDGSFEDNRATGDGQYGGGALYADGSQITLTGTRFADNVASQGGAIAAADSFIELSQVVVEGGSATDSGGALHLTTSVVASVGTMITGASAEMGGAVHVGAGAVYDGSEDRFSLNTASRGGAISAEGATLRLYGAYLDGNEAAVDGGAIYGGAGAAVTLVGSDIVQGRAWRNGGGIAAIDAVLSLDGVLFADLVADGAGGGLHALRSSVSAARSTWQRNDAAGDGGAILLEACPVAASIAASALVDNTADRGGALAVPSGEPVSDLWNNSWLGNMAAAEGAHIWANAPLDLVNNLFGHGEGAAGIWASGDAADGSSRSHNAAWDHPDGAWGGGFTDPGTTDGHQSADCELRHYEPTVDVDQDLRLVAGSPCIDAGWIAWNDPDGSRSDIGAFGGPEANVVDADGDGVWSHEDCDDLAPSVGAGTTEIAYDGIDQDCDGSDLADLDGDGSDSNIVGGADCDDDDPDRGPHALEHWYDGVDQDCDGADDFDQDGDGFALDDDCDDTRTDIHPGAVELPYDGVDSDCDPTDNELDADRDGYDAAAFGGTDCDDTDPLVGPGRTEIPYDGIDQDCDGGDLNDLDGDGFANTLANNGPDCDDADPLVHPAAAEVWYDGVDQDCDGNDIDRDGDGWGSATYGGGDCNDDDPLVSPGAREVWYDGHDQDCDGGNDFDQDGDGYLVDEDCDDRRANAHPGAPERRNGLDEDCDGFAEDADRDSDGLQDWDEWQLGTDPETTDSDGDGRTDGEETPVVAPATDTDGDGVVDALDPDDDNDGISSLTEWTVDVDGDGIPDTDVDDDGVPNSLDTDSDGDGISDSIEGEDDVDYDGIPDFVDFQGALTGGGCATGQAGLWLLFLPMLGRFRRTSIVLLPTTAVAAEAVDIHGFEVLDTSGELRSFSRLATPNRDIAYGAGLLVDYSHRAVVESTPDGRVPVVEGTVSGTLVADFRPLKGLSIDIALPVGLGFGPTRTFGGAGDPRIGVSYSPLSPDGKLPGVSAHVWTWIGAGGDGFGFGSARPSVGGVVALQENLGPVTLAMNAGARWSPPGGVRDIQTGSGPLMGLAAGWQPTDTLSVTAEATMHGHTGWRTPPVEATLTLRARLPKGAWAAAGVSAGLTDGVGASAARVFAMAGWHWRPKPKPPEPDLPMAVVAPLEDRVDEPLPEPEPVVVEAPPRERLVIRESLFFAEDSDRLLSKSKPALDAVVGILRDRAEIRYLLIEGHTNDNGADAYNVDLGLRRAMSVMDALVALGIDPDRLVPKGYGFHRRLVPAGHADAARLNRRVEFSVLRPEETPEDLRMPAVQELP